MTTRTIATVRYDPGMAIDEIASTDGRRARRDRNRTAVIDAMFQLLDEGVAPLQTEAIALRAGVSVSSIFRYFESLEDLQQETIDRHFARFAPLFDVPALGEGALDERIDALVDARLRLYGSVAPVARLARSRAWDQPRIAQTLHAARQSFVDQIRSQFALELAPMTRAAADDAVALIDTLTAFESWDLLRTTHGRSDRLIRRAWTAGLHRFLTP